MWPRPRGFEPQRYRGGRAAPTDHIHEARQYLAAAIRKVELPRRRGRPELGLQCPWRSLKQSQSKLRRRRRLRRRCAHRRLVLLVVVLVVLVVVVVVVLALVLVVLVVLVVALWCRLWSWCCWWCCWWWWWWCWWRSWCWRCTFPINIKV